MALLTTQETTLTGLTTTYAAATGGGDTFLPDDRTFLHVVNGGVGSITVTVTTPGTVISSIAIADPVTTVANGTSRMIGPFPFQVFADPTTGVASIAYSGVSSVTIAVIRVPART